MYKDPNHTSFRNGHNKSTPSTTSLLIAMVYACMDGWAGNTRNYNLSRVCPSLPPSHVHNLSQP